MWLVAPFRAWILGASLLLVGSSQASPQNLTGTQQRWHPPTITFDGPLLCEDGEYTVRWFNPRDGGRLHQGTVPTISGAGWTSTGEPSGQDNEDWVILIERSE